MNYDDSAKFGLQSSEREQVCVPGLEGKNVGRPEGTKRTRVIITSLRTRILDKDNAYSGAKSLLDSIKKSGLINDDSEKEIDYEVKQIKVAHRKDEKTVVDVDYGD